MGRRRRYVALDECLQESFLDPDFTDPQDKSQRWAIVEGIKRLHSYQWEISSARKEHNCIRGCDIKAGDTYFKRGIGGGWGSAWKFCAGCMAMILHFKEVDKLPVYMYTHWDFETNEPVNLERE